jgi:PAS domain S-box-containing protein
MLSEISNNLDFAFFCYGLAYILMAAVCVPLSRDEREKLPWSLLAAYGALLGAVAWMNLIAISLGDTMPHFVARLIVMSTAYLFLVEFARVGLAKFWKWIPSRLIYVPLLILASLGILGGEEGLKVTPRYALALIGGIGAAAALYCASQSERTGRRSLRVASVAMLVAAVTSGLIGSTAPLFPASVLNQELFLRLTGIPIPIVRGGLAIVMALVLATYFIRQQRHRESTKTDTITPFSKWMPPALLGVLVVGWFATHSIGKQYERNLVAQAQLSAGLAAATIESENIQGLKSDHVPDSAAEIAEIEEHFTRLQHSNQRFIFLQLLQVINDRAIPHVTRSWGACAGLPHLHEISASQSNPAEELTQSEVGTIIYRDRQNRFVRIVLPLRNDLGAQGEDFFFVAELDTRTWRREIFAVRLFPLGTTLLFALGLIALDVARQRSRLISRRIAESERRYRSLVEGAPNCILLIDSSGQILSVNRNGVEAVGKTEDQLLGHHFVELWTEDRRLQAAENLGLALRGRRSEFEAEYQRADSRSIMWHVVLNPILDEQRPVQLCVGILTDISRRRAMELALLQSELRLRNVIEKSNDAIFVRQGSRLVMVNPKFEEAFGYAADELYEQDFDLLSFVAPESLEFVRSKLEAQQADKPLHDRYSFKGLAKGGAVREFEVNVSRIKWDSHPATLGMMRDVTDQRALEAHLQQTQRLESIGRLAGGVAHDFNNLLTIITGYSELGLLTVGERDPIRSELEVILKTSKRAANLTRQLLAFSRRQVISPQVLDVNSVILDMDKMLRRIIREDIELKSVPLADLWPVKADPGQLEQVIVNLVVNARDAMPKGGRLTIETMNVVLDDYYTSSHPVVSPGPYAMFAVSDTGHGMSEEIRTKVFEPFFTTKPAGVGTGLGLATVYGIVKQSSGYIWVYSEPGFGTTFKVYLPATTERAEEIRRTVLRPTVATGHESILLVEDNDEVRELAAQALIRFGYKVLEACSGEEAYEMAEGMNGAVDMVITDLIMPNMNGTELTERIRTLWPHIKVILMSGYMDNTIGMDGTIPYLQKPFGPLAIAQKVREVLDESKVTAIPGSSSGYL